MYYSLEPFIHFFSSAVEAVKVRAVFGEFSLMQNFSAEQQKSLRLPCLLEFWSLFRNFGSSSAHKLHEAIWIFTWKFYCFLLLWPECSFWSCFVIVFSFPFLGVLPFSASCLGSSIFRSDSFPYLSYLA